MYHMHSVPIKTGLSALDAQELELEKFVNHHVGVGELNLGPVGERHSQLQQHLSNLFIGI